MLIDDLIINFDGETLQDQYKPEAFYLVQWFFRQAVASGFNGPTLVPVINYEETDAYIDNVFQFLFSLLMKYQANQAKT